MADLMSTSEGRSMLLRVACWLGRQRMSRRLMRSFYLAYHEYLSTGSFSLSTLLGQLNPADQDEVLAIGRMIGSTGCEGSTVSDMTIYVDGTNGSDSTGDGTSDHPYASLQFLYDRQFPQYINHSVRILIVNDTSVESLHFPFTIGPFGCISLIGVGPPTVVNTSQGLGPFTANPVVPHGPPFSAFEWTTAPFGTDELYGKWVQFLDNTNEDWAIQAHSNDNTAVVMTRAGWTAAGPQNNDTYRVIEPAHTLSVSTVDLNCQGPGFVFATNRSSRVNIFNLNIDIRTGITSEGQFRIRNSCHTNLSFVRILVSGADSYFLHIESPINEWMAWDSQAAVLANTGIANLDWDQGGDTNCGLYVYNSAWPPVVFAPVNAVINCNTERIVGLDTRGRVVAKGAFGQLEKSAVDQIQFGGEITASTSPASGTVIQCLLGGHPTAAAAYLFSAGMIRVVENYFHAGLNCIEAECGNLEIDGNLGSGAVGFTGYGMLFNNLCRCVTRTNPLGILVGAGPPPKDILFADPATGAQLWPLLNFSQADTIGNIVTYLP